MNASRYIEEWFCIGGRRKYMFSWGKFLSTGNFKILVQPRSMQRCFGGIDCELWIEAFNIHRGITCDIFVIFKNAKRKTFWKLKSLLQQMSPGSDRLVVLPLGKAISSIKGSPGGHLGIYGEIPREGWQIATGNSISRLAQGSKYSKVYFPKYIFPRCIFSKCICPKWGFRGWQ